LAVVFCFGIGLMVTSVTGILAASEAWERIVPRLSCIGQNARLGWFSTARRPVRLHKVRCWVFQKTQKPESGILGITGTFRQIMIVGRAIQ
jgi:hypothetical protein